MSFAMEEAERYRELQIQSAPDKYVCADCIEDCSLGAIVADHLEADQCDYCQTVSEEPIAAQLELIVEHMAECIARRYTDPGEEMTHVSAEGGYQGITFEGSEILEEIGFEVENAALMEDLSDCFNDGLWCKWNHSILEEREKLNIGWERFAEAVKHERRYTFWSMDDQLEDPRHPDYLPVGQMLKNIQEIITRFSLIRNFSTVQALWRVRVHKKSEQMRLPDDLCTTPRDLTTQPNRMSPAGIAMFYAGEDFETSCAETLEKKNLCTKQVSGVRFFSTRPLLLLDLYDLPQPVSFFDLSRQNDFDPIGFLHDFQREISKPIKRGDKSHIEYVPTQVLSEYIRYEFKTAEGKSLDGIKYRSSKNGKASFVIFAEHGDCLDESDQTFGHQQLLRCDIGSLRVKGARSVYRDLQKLR